MSTMTPRSRVARSPSTTTVTRSRSHTARPSAAIFRVEVIPPECRFRPAFHRVSQDVLRLITDERERERLSVRFPHNPLERIDQVPEAMLRSYGFGGGPTQFGSSFRHLRLEFIARLAKFFFRPLALADVAADSCKANVSAVWIRKRAYVVKHPDGCAGLKMAEPDLDF